MSFLDETGLTYLWKKIKLAAYPVGWIYVSTSGSSRATLFGWSWGQIQDMFLLAAGSTYSAGATGGEASHTLTANEMPAHTHSIPKLSGSTSTNGEHKHDVPSVEAGTTGGSLTILGGDGSTPSTSAGSHSHTVTTNASTTGSAGGGKAHNNMPPYLSVYMWKRTA